MKLTQFQKHLKTSNIDLAFFFHPDPSILYFTQQELSHGMLIIRPAKATLFHTKLDNITKIKDITTKIAPSEWESKFKNTQIKTVGINENTLTLTQHKKLKQLFPQATFTDVSKQLTLLRTTKTPQEITLIKKAAQITDSTYKKVINNFSRFSTELDIVQFIENTIKQAGAQLSFPPIVAMASNAAIPHYKPKKVKLKKGFLLLDFGAKYHNYCADMTRMLYLGTPSNQEKEDYTLLLNAQEQAIQSLEANKSFQAIHQEVQEHLADKATYFIHGLGHGVGVEIHEAPLFKQAKIQNNQVFTIEPGIYLKEYGLRIEDTVLFDKKPLLLTKTPKKLKIINSQKTF